MKTFNSRTKTQIFIIFIPKAQFLFAPERQRRSRRHWFLSIVFSVNPVEFHILAYFTIQIPTVRIMMKTYF